MRHPLVGASISLADRYDDRLVQPLYMSPEVMTGDTVSTASDIYSFGISLWEFITRQEAFSHHTTFAGLKASVVVAHERPVIPADCPASLAGLLVRCWAPDPSLRPDAATVVNELSALIEEEKIQLQWDKVVAAIPFDDGRHFWYYAFTDVRCERARATSMVW